jgi:hypothetical protein
MIQEINIDTKITANGFQVSVGNQKYPISYPQFVWDNFPGGYRKLLADSLAVAFTQHLLFTDTKGLNYGFPPPITQPYIFYELIYSVATAPAEFPKSNFTISKLLKNIYNSDFNIKYKQIPYPLDNLVSRELSEKNFVMPFSFGKDSLLTYSVMHELGFQPFPIFFREPTCIEQNKTKEAMRIKFIKQFNQDIMVIPNNLGNLRDKGGLMWGWDLLLVEYTMLALPFVYANKAKYFFWSNEQSLNETEIDNEGYVVNMTHDQSSQSVLKLNNLFRIFGSNAKIASVIEPLHELAIMYLLHTRFPQIGAYQKSCDTEGEKNPKWCGKCYECARVYAFLLVIGVDPKTVGFTDDMMTKKSLKLFHLFDNDIKKQSLDIIFPSKGERLLTLYLCYKQGIKNDVITAFKHQYLPYVERRKNELFAKYLVIHTSETMPKDLQNIIMPFYRKHLTPFFEKSYRIGSSSLR